MGNLTLHAYHVRTIADVRGVFSRYQYIKVEGFHLNAATGTFGASFIDPPIVFRESDSFTSAVMKVILLVAAVAAQVSARPQSQTNNPHEWIAPGPDDCKSSVSLLQSVS
jgi:hypothetical protein